MAHPPPSPLPARDFSKTATAEWNKARGMLEKDNLHEAYACFARARRFLRLKLEEPARSASRCPPSRVAAENERVVAMGVKDLKSALTRLNIKFSGIVEKGDLRQMLATARVASTIAAQDRK